MTSISDILEVQIGLTGLKRQMRHEIITIESLIKIPNQRSARIWFVLIRDFDSWKWIKIFFLIFDSLIILRIQSQMIGFAPINWPSESLIHFDSICLFSKANQCNFWFFDFWFWFDLIHSEVGPQSVIVRWVIFTRALSLAAGLGLMTHTFHTGSFQKNRQD